MSGCQADALEAYACGELDAAEADRIAAHVEACPRCAGELAWLRRERRLFAGRAAAHPAPPPFEAVLARALAPAAARPAEAAPARRVGRPAARDRRARPAARATRPRAPWGVRIAVAAAALAIGAAVLWPAREEAPPLTAETLPPAPARAAEPPAPVAEEHPELVDGIRVRPASCGGEHDGEESCESATCVTCEECGPQGE